MGDRTYPDRIWVERDEETNEKRWFTVPGMGVEYALAKAASPAGGDVRGPTPDMKIGFVDGYEAALGAVKAFRIKMGEPFDSTFERHKGFVHDMLKTNAEKLRSSLSQSTAGEAVDPTPALAPAPSAWPKDPETGLNDLSLTSMLRGAAGYDLASTAEFVAKTAEDVHAAVRAAIRLCQIHVSEAMDESTERRELRFAIFNALEMPTINAREAAIAAQRLAVALAKPQRVEKRPANCRNRLRDEGKAYPKSGCASCGNGGIMGCPHERADDNKDTGHG